jgi:hypothetical protein
VALGDGEGRGDADTERDAEGEREAETLPVGERDTAGERDGTPVGRPLTLAAAPRPPPADADAAADARVLRDTLLVRVSLAEPVSVAVCEAAPLPDEAGELLTS